MHYEIKTYNRMPLNSISEIDTCVGKDYNGDLLLRYDASQFVNINKLADSVVDLEPRLIDIEPRLMILENRVDYSNEIEILKEENFQLKERLDRLEMLLGDN